MPGRAVQERSATGQGVAVVVWWEIRRPLYNISVAVSGVVSLIAVAIIAPDYFPEPFSIVILGPLYGLLCNICYTGGWIIDLVLRDFCPRLAPGFRPAAFISGLGLSVLVPCLLPLFWLVYLAGCDHGLSEADLPGAYGSTHGVASYALRIDGDGRYEETYIAKTGDVYVNAGTWQSSMGQGEPEILLHEAIGDPFSPLTRPPSTSNWRLGLRSCWGKTALHLPHNPDDVILISKIN